MRDLATQRVRRAPQLQETGLPGLLGHHVLAGPRAIRRIVVCMGNGDSVKLLQNLVHPAQVIIQFPKIGVPVPSFFEVVPAVPHLMI